MIRRFLTRWGRDATGALGNGRGFCAAFCGAEKPRPTGEANLLEGRGLRGKVQVSARFQRWRPDRTPASCTYEQLDTPVPMELREIFGV